MAVERDELRDWHRLFGLLLTDFFTGSPFIVEVERDLSEQQQFLDVVIVRRGRGRLAVPLPDGLDDLKAHNLITFKSHHEALDGWAMKELLSHYVAYPSWSARRHPNCCPKIASDCTRYAPGFRRTCPPRFRGKNGRPACMIVRGEPMWYA